MIPFQLGLEGEEGENDKYDQGNHFLCHFQLQKRETPPVPVKSDTVCRHLKTVFEKGDQPTKNNHSKKRQFTEPCIFRQF